VDENLTRPAAAFVAQALDMPGDPERLADDLTLVADDGVVVTFAIELESTAGVVAFLVYVYRLASRVADGALGRERMERDLATMAEAERLDAPGPRPVAQADDGALGFVLATTPAILRALSGESPPTAEAPPIDRGEAATALLARLRATEDAARTWLASAPDDGSPRTSEETELALHLLEPGNLDPLLTAIGRLTNVGPGDAMADDGD
jgi:aminoglycoside phosphotransferase (APT) family kinase protein